MQSDQHKSPTDILSPTVSHYLPLSPTVSRHLSSCLPHHLLLPSPFSPQPQDLLSVSLGVGLGLSHLMSAFVPMSATMSDSIRVGSIVVTSSVPVGSAMKASTSRNQPTSFAAIDE
ncbi:hypothetical protein [Phaffia rhodozyma]|uniref:Uncharacterized protein n=1 Tax=Phaffia rhodozyma TaxID=264483 RepID=A0A0F7STA7_PHARH|nr:hypothetical protein [Phaffia rhodozyma]